MNFLNKPKWKRILLAAICCLTLAVLASGSYAAYTRQAFQRGVARNGEAETIRFTSDYLQNCANETTETDYSSKVISYTDSQKNSGDSVEFEFCIYNYANGNKSQVSQKSITYDLEIKFSDGSGSGYVVTDDTGSTVNPDSSGICKVENKTLISNVAKEHKYKLLFPGSDIDKLRIIITATPTNLSITNNQKLAIVITPCTGTMTSAFSFDGKFIDAPEEGNNPAPTQYYGFNYEISISTGIADVTLEWNADYLEIDRFFLYDLLKDGNENDAQINTKISQVLKDKKIIFKMDQAGGTGDYLIPFYRTNVKEIPATWDELKKYITFTAVPRDSSTETGFSDD